MATLLVIDDDASILECFRLCFPTPETEVVTAQTAEQGLTVFTDCSPDAICLDIHLPDLSGLETFRRIRELDPKVPVIIMTGSGTTATAIQAMALGALEYILKPFESDQIISLVSRAFEIARLMRAPAVVRDASSPGETGDVLVGQCSAMQEVYKAIGRVAQQDITILVLGESGTGKELVARAIYRYSRRAGGPFLAINCAAIPETLLESELFGHEKGAFTGAEQRRIGKFEQCHGGTLFLDEIGDMTPATQAKILRVLQDQQFERVGGNQPVQTNVRLIAATNRDLEAMVHAGEFRKDLYYRLNTFTIKLPTLRERKEDIPLLAEHFLRRFRGELGKAADRIAVDAMELLKSYAWPGNLRELQSVLKQALIHTSGPVLLREFLPPAIRGQTASAVSDSEGSSASATEEFIRERLGTGSTDLYAEWLALTSRQLFLQVLKHSESNLSQAARILGIHPMTLRSKLRALGIKVERQAAMENEPD